MVSAICPAPVAISEPITGQYQFISVPAPGGPGEKAAKRLARSHAVKRALENKRRSQKEALNNFRIVTSKHKPRELLTGRLGAVRSSASPYSLAASALDPFQTLAVNSTRLQTLLEDRKARQAAEPVFTIAEELAFQNFKSVFRTGLVDPALLNAAMLSFEVAVAEGRVSQEGLVYQGHAISHIRQKMNSPDDAISESTIGAILLLAGVEARLGMTSQVRMHMGAVDLLLAICRSNSIYLTSGIKRAIFWQDLNSSILTGSDRIVDHTTFTELHWTRDPFSSAFYRLPPAFQARSHLLSLAFVEILEDINALQCIRDLECFIKTEIMQMAHINNHTASIQSRLADLQSTSPVMRSCHLAAYLCSVMLCCKIWCALVIPSSISSQLLDVLKVAIDDPFWDEDPKLLLWLLFIGGAFTPETSVRQEYGSLLRSKSARCSGLYATWPKLLEIAKQFIWSDRAFTPYFKSFWNEVSG